MDAKSLKYQAVAAIAIKRRARGMNMEQQGKITSGLEALSDDQQATCISIILTHAWSYGTTDDFAAVVENYSKPKEGVPSARIKAWKLSAANWLEILDGDLSCLKNVSWDLILRTEMVLQIGRIICQSAMTSDSNPALLYKKGLAGVLQYSELAPFIQTCWERISTFWKDKDFEAKKKGGDKTVQLVLPINFLNLMKCVDVREARRTNSVAYNQYMRTTVALVGKCYSDLSENAKDIKDRVTGAAWKPEITLLGVRKDSTGIDNYWRFLSGVSLHFSIKGTPSKGPVMKTGEADVIKPDELKGLIANLPKKTD